MMEWPSITWIWALFFLVHFSVHGTSGCLDEERSTLLLIKASINHPNATSLPSWEEGTDCCSWERVECNSYTGRVVELYLNYTRESYDMGEWYLNASLLLPLQELRSLDLSHNYQLAGLNEGEALRRGSTALGKLEILQLSDNSISSGERILPYLRAFPGLRKLDLGYNSMNFSYDGVQRLPRLSKLEELDLSHNNFNNETILPYLIAFPGLTKLNLSHNSMNFSYDGVRRLSRLSKLEDLDLSYNNFNIEIILPYVAALESLSHLNLGGNKYFHNGPPIEELTALSNLEELDLDYLNYGVNTTFKGPIPSSIESFTSLRALSLVGSTLNDSQSIQGICKLKTLEELDLSRNKFEGPFPKCLSNLTELRLLDLSDNNFSGNVPTDTIGSLTSLVYFSLYKNHFSGMLPFSSFANLSKLEAIDFSNNELEVDTESAPWVPTFKLKFVSLSNCSINKITNGSIPKFLYNQSDLRRVYLSHNNLEGRFPTWLLENNTRLAVLELANNLLTGPFHLPQQNSNREKGTLDISNNHIQGELPKNIGIYFPNLWLLNMSGNALHGFIPPSIGNMKSLLSLDLSHNNLSGEIPRNLTGCIALTSLKLSNNILHGEIFPTYFNLTLLKFLHLDNNQFTGTIQPSLFPSSYLMFLDISNNYVSGRIPSQIRELSSLQRLILSENNFEGSIPFELCELSELSSLDLSKNTLSGSIPSCFNSTSLMHIHLDNNQFSGVIPRALLENLPSLVSLDISHNNIGGGIPNLIGKHSDLRLLLLKGNHLHGCIPDELCKLKKLQILDLSNNSFSGSVPKCISDLAFGKANVADAFDGGTSRHSVIYDVKYSYKIRLMKFSTHYEFIGSAIEPQEVEFVSKRRSNSYKGGILRYMSGIDLSYNQFTGEIPHEFGQLNGLHALNLSYNVFRGSIPKTFSNLSQIESMDLSHNNLSGAIPSELVVLNFLSTFSVGYNDLSGPIPETGQFFSFEEDSFVGNPQLCGSQVKRNCSTTPPPVQGREEEDTSDNGIISFYASFLGSYFIFLLGTVIVLYYSPRSLDICLYYINYSCTSVMCSLRRILRL